MQVDSPEKLRNVAVAGHNDTGKTTLVSALLYAGGVTTRLHRVEDGNTLTDFDHEESERRISIGLAACFLPWQQHKINLLDCPGYGIFFSETQQGLRAADAAILCVNGVAGVEVNTEKVWKAAAELELPLMVNLTKMDRERADFDRALEDLHKRFGRGVLPVQIPIGQEAGFSGVVDLVNLKAYQFTRDGNGKATPADIPANLAEMVETHRARLVEAVAETDDRLMEGFFENGTIPQEDLVPALRRAVARRQIFPLTLSAGGHGIGPSALLDAVLALLPSPADRLPFPATNVGGEEIGLAGDPAGPLAVLVFKTLSDPFTGKISLLRVVSGTLSADTNVWNSRAEEAERLGHLIAVEGKQGGNVPRLIAGDIGGVAKLKITVSGDTLCAKDKPIKLAWISVPEAAMAFAVEPKSKGDEEKIGDALHRLMDEDIALHAGRDPESHEHLLSGNGQLHIEIAVAKLKHRFHVDVLLHPPRVPYRETILKPADGHGRHKKQTGGRGQFADCKIKVEPLARGEDFSFADEIFGGAIPHNYRPAVEKGIQEARRRGYLAGYPMVDFKVRLLDGQYHDVDSSEMAFKIAGSLAFKDAMQNAKPTILEPVMKVDITTTEEFTGDIMGDLSHRRGRPQGMDAVNGNQIIKALVPMSEMLDYDRILRAMTQGRSSFHMEFSHYEEVPKMVQDKLVAEAQKHRQEEHE
ncbi:MAG TPA: elongation factor G [Thermoanaerobaculia bacterium]|jgi:elongation factor G|nr:elongation factor G [Thermoanaerobaculia bacterium]